MIIAGPCQVVLYTSMDLNIGVGIAGAMYQFEPDEARVQVKGLEKVGPPPADPGWGFSRAGTQRPQLLRRTHQLSASST
jgi:hypothetical protein